MTKELFIATINSIQKQIEIDRKNSSMLQEMFPKLKNWKFTKI